MIRLTIWGQTTHSHSRRVMLLIQSGKVPVILPFEISLRQAVGDTLQNWKLAILQTPAAIQVLVTSAS